MRKLNLSEMHQFLPRESRGHPSALPAVHLSSPGWSSPPAARHSCTVICIAGLLNRSKMKAAPRRRRMQHIHASAQTACSAAMQAHVRPTCVCPTLAAAVTACWAACAFPMTASLLWCCCGSVGASAAQSWPSRMVMTSGWPLSVAWTSAHWPLLSVRPTWSRGVTKKGTGLDGLGPVP